MAEHNFIVRSTGCEPPGPPPHIPNSAWSVQARAILASVSSGVDDIASFTRAWMFRATPEIICIGILNDSSRDIFNAIHLDDAIRTVHV